MTESKPPALRPGTDARTASAQADGPVIEPRRDEARRKGPVSRTGSWAFRLEVEPRDLLQNYVELL